MTRMNWSNVKLILAREIRDQLRDRRTLFMIAVLPLLLYPLLGMSFFQISQFMREQPTQIRVLGEFEFQGLPPLVEGDRFAKNLFLKPEGARLLELKVETAEEQKSAALDERLASAREAVQRGEYEVAIYFPPDFSERLEQFRAELDRPPGEQSEKALKVPSPTIYYNTAKEESQITYYRVADVLNHWRDMIGRQNLEKSRVPATAASPFDLETDDVADVRHRKAAAWSKILPFVLLLWALTGAFYPAVDLCAGEKERGTLETLLSSPAERTEIVWGKLLTIMLFSIATALLNLLSMGLTGSLILTHLPDFGPPPTGALVWLVVALIPMSALFSALCLALAAFARSTKEGQYYLMPLVLITMPLTVLPMAPGVQLNLGNSVIPITGMVLLLRSILEGDYATALPYVPIVMGVTLGCCLLAVRWAADQFNKESVLFRESERLDFGLWLKHLLRDREDTPSVAEALFCGVLILLIHFFMNSALAAAQPDPAVLILVSQLVVIATPALLMTIMLTRSPRKTLLLRLPRAGSVTAAVVLALALHPFSHLLRSVIVRVYPLNEEVARQLNQFVAQQEQLGVLLVLIALVPAICEELAFRGFILSGLRHIGRKWRAIVISSIFFGVAHSILQQSLYACVMGVVLGYLAVQTGSLLPGILFHLTHNALSVALTKLPVGSARDKYPILDWLMKRDPGEMDSLYHWPIVAIGLAVAAALLYWFHKLPYPKTAEESLQEAIEQSDHGGVESALRGVQAQAPSVP